MKRRTFALLMVFLMIAGLLSPLQAKAASAPKFKGKLQNFVWNEGNTGVYNVKVEDASASDLYWYVEDKSGVVHDLNTQEGRDWLLNFGCGESCGPVPGAQRFVISSMPKAIDGFKLYCVASTPAGTTYCSCTLSVDSTLKTGPNQKWVDDPAAFFPALRDIELLDIDPADELSVTVGENVWNASNENVKYTWMFASNPDDISTGNAAKFSTLNAGNGIQKLVYDRSGSNPDNPFKFDSSSTIFYLACKIEETTELNGKKETNTSYTSILPYRITWGNPPGYNWMYFNTEPTKKNYKVGDTVDLAGLNMQMCCDHCEGPTTDTTGFKALPSKIESVNTSKVFVISDGGIVNGYKEMSGYHRVAGYDITVAAPTPTPVPTVKFTGKLQNFVWKTGSKATYNVSVENASASDLYWYVTDKDGVIHDVNTNEGLTWLRSLGCGDSSGPVSGKKRFVIEKMTIAMDGLKLYCVASNKIGTDYCACTFRTETWVEANPNQQWVDDPGSFIVPNVIIDYHKNMEKDPDGNIQEVLSAGDHIWSATDSSIIYRWFYAKNTDDIYMITATGLEDINNDPGSQTIYFDWLCNVPGDTFYMEDWGCRYLCCLVQEPVGTNSSGNTIYNYNYTSIVPVLYYAQHNNGLSTFRTMYFNTEPSKKTYQIGEKVDLSGFNMEVISDRNSHESTKKSEFVTLPSVIESASTKKVFVISHYDTARYADELETADNFGMITGYSITVKEPTPTPTEVPVNTPSPVEEATPTPTAVPTGTPDPTETPTPTKEPVKEPTAAPTTAPEPTSAETPTEAATPTPAGGDSEPTTAPAEPTKTETPTNTPAPTNSANNKDKKDSSSKKGGISVPIIVGLVVLIALLSAGTGILSTIIFMKRKNGIPLSTDKKVKPVEDEVLPIEDLDDFQVDLDDDPEFGGKNKGKKA